MDNFKFSLTNEQVVLLSYALDCCLDHVRDHLSVLEHRFDNDRYGIVATYQAMRSDLQNLELELHFQGSAFLNEHGLKSFSD